MDDTDSAKWSSIAASLQSDPIQAQAKAWEKERIALQEIVQTFWQAEAAQFKTYWEEPSHIEGVAAIIIAALDDIQGGAQGAVLGVTCPELQDWGGLLKPQTVPGIFEMIIGGKEKTKLEEDTTLIKADLPPQSMKFLQLARSISMLNFLSNVLLMYQQVDETNEHIQLELE